MRKRSTAFVSVCSLLCVAGAARGQALYRLGVGPGRAETQVSLMSRDGHSFLIRTMSGVGAGFDYFSRQSLELHQPGIRAQWTTFGASIAPGSSGGTQFYGTYTINASSYAAAYSDLAGAATPLTLQGGSVSLGRSAFQDGNSAPLASFTAIGNARATGFDRPFIYRPGSGSGPFSYLDLPGGFSNALAQRVSDDGRYTYGYAYNNSTARLLVWDGTSVLTNATFPGGLSIHDVNADGSIALGRQDNQPVLIARDGTITSLGATPGGGTVVPSAISGDGSTVIGSATFSNTGAWVWTASHGFATANSYFAGLVPADSLITRLDFISQDGTTFAGQMSTSVGLEAFVITGWAVPAPSTAAAMALAGLVATRRRRS